VRCCVQRFSNSMRCAQIHPLFSSFDSNQIHVWVIGKLIDFLILDMDVKAIKLFSINSKSHKDHVAA
jgi:hypothetical protein